MKKTKRNILTALLLSAASSVVSTSAEAKNNDLVPQPEYGPPSFYYGKGDVNGDGIVNAVDITHLLRTKCSEYHSDADLNKDGIVDDSDTEMLLNFLKGRTSNPDIPEDVNRSGSVDGMDLSDLRYFIKCQSKDTSLDLNSDNIVDKADYLLLRQYLIKHGIRPDDGDAAFMSDVNGDGELNLQDAVEFSRIIRSGLSQLDSRADLNADGTSNFDDLNTMIEVLLQEGFSEKEILQACEMEMQTKYGTFPTVEQEDILTTITTTLIQTKYGVYPVISKEET